MIFKGRITDIIYRNDYNDYTIAIFETDDIYFTVVGYIPELMEQDIQIKGKTVTHDKYGEQFLIEEYEYIKPTTVEDIYNFLTYNSIDGLGVKTVNKIIDLFGENTLHIMNNEIHRLTEVSGIGKSKLKIIEASYSKIVGRQNIILFLNKLGIKGKKVSLLINLYGNRVIETIEKNPYTLFFDVKEMSFNEVDTIAKTLSFDDDNYYRIEAIIIQVLRMVLVNGSTYINKQELLTIVNRDYGLEINEVEDCLDSLLNRGYVRIIDENVFLIQTYLTINSIARSIKRISSNKNDISVKGEVLYVEQKKGIHFSSKQTSAIESAFHNKVSIITGGPGTGKTTIIETICEIALDNALKIKLAAPTGRAAVKMKNASFHDAKTIHRLLEYKFSEENNVLSFDRNEDNPIEADIIIIDEASMIDIFLFEKLLAAIDDSTILVLIGDSNQLPSVGPGKVLLDIIKSEKIKTTTLDVVYRQGSESVISYNSNLIVNGDTNLIEQGAKDYFTMDLNVKSSYKAIETLIKKSIPNTYHIDTFWDLQVLTPTKKGPLGTIELNKFLQSIINPEGIEFKHGSRIFRENDKVIMTKNNYNVEWTDRFDHNKNKGVFNGEIGIIEKIDLKEKEVHILFEKQKYVVMKQSEMDLIMHAYAITVHKSQGCEYEGVLLAMGSVSHLLANRSVVYTAITRARDLFMLIGDKKLYNYAIQNNKVATRNTFLSTLIVSYFENDF